MNLIWMNQSLVYFHKCINSGKFPGELNYIRLNLGLLQEYHAKSSTP